MRYHACARAAAATARPLVRPNVACRPRSALAGNWLLGHAYSHGFTSSVVWTVANIPVLIASILTWLFGVPLSILLCIHTFMMLTSSTTCAQPLHACGPPCGHLTSCGRPAALQRRQGGPSPPPSSLAPLIPVMPTIVRVRRRAGMSL